jgi:multiple sugar transport system permease protein
MDKLNIVQKTVVSIILATMVISVVVPILFFLTVAFSNDVEMTQFPKRIFSNFSVTVKVASGENGEYELFHDRGDGEGYRPIITTKNPTKLENHFKRQ